MKREHSVYMASSEETILPCRVIPSQFCKLNIFQCPIFVNYIAKIEYKMILFVKRVSTVLILKI